MRCTKGHQTVWPAKLASCAGEAPEQQTLTVTKAAAHAKGNTASGSGNIVQLETGVSIQVPAYVKEGDQLVVNTDTGAFVKRA